MKTYKLCCWARRCLLALGVLLLATSFLAANEPYLLCPKTYDGFQPVETFASFEEAVQKGTCLLLHSQVRVNNPLLIDRDRPLLIHGSPNGGLIARDPSKPLFVVKQCPYLNCARLTINSGATPELAAARKGNLPLISFENTTPIRVDLMQVTLLNGIFSIGGPGKYVFQNVSYWTDALTFACVVVDHPQAEFYWIGSHDGMGNFTRLPAVDSDDMHHVWQKRGHVSIYGTLPVAGRGRGDYRFDTPSPKGCHIVAGVRSEGNNYGGSPECWKRSRLVYVPPTAEKVNVAVKGSYLCGDVNSPFVEYNGRGTLWLIGNKCDEQTHVVEGKAHGATVMLYGNSLAKGTELTNLDLGPDGRLIDMGNLVQQGSGIAFSVPANTFANCGPAPEPPNVDADLPLVGSPAVGEEQIKALGLVSVKQFGARGDGRSDDTVALQKAFDEAGQHLFFPVGTYLINQPIFFHPPATAGWVAGAGADKTVIRNISDDTVLWCQSLPGYTFQGITFASSGKSQPNFISEKITGQNTFTTYYDCTFRGGLYGLSYANFINTGNCEAIMIARCRFEDCQQGLSVGYANSLGVNVRDCYFVDNDIAYRIGGDWTGAWQGQFSVLGAHVRGTKLFETEPNHMHNIYLWGVDSDSKVIYNGGLTSFLFFDNCIYHGGTPGHAIITSPGTPGPILLHSRVLAGTFVFPSNITAYAFKLYSRIGEWADSRARMPVNVRFYDSDEGINTAAGAAKMP